MAIATFVVAVGLKMWEEAAVNAVSFHYARTPLSADDDLAGFDYADYASERGKRKVMLKALRILIVDDQRRTRQSLKALLATKFQPIETYEAVNGVEAIHDVEEYKPRIVLMDARMPEMDGIEATRIIKTGSPWVQVIVLSMYAEYQAGALAAGAYAFISKGEPPERLLAAVSAIASATGESEISDEQAV